MTTEMNNTENARASLRFVLHCYTVALLLVYQSIDASS